MLSPVIMRPIALLMENQKWEVSFKIIDSRKFWVVRPIKMIIDSYSGREFESYNSLGGLLVLKFSVTFY